MVPVGGIIQWSGSISNIPDHYQICDGSNGTPNLRDRFVRGVEPGLHEVGDTGGADGAVIDPPGTVAVAAGTDHTAWDGSKSKSIQTIPKFMALYFIMRMS